MPRPGARSSQDPVRYIISSITKSRADLSLFCAAWAKDEPPSPTDSYHELPSPRGSYVPSDAHRSDMSQHSSAGPSGEHRWFPFTRRRPMLPPPEMFGAEPSLTRLERRPTISLGFHHRDDRSLEQGDKGPEQGTSSRTLDRGFRLRLPTTPAAPYTLPQSRTTPGWDSPWAARSLESFSHRNIYEQLQNGESAEEQPVEDSTTANVSWWPRARKRARAYLLNNTYVPLVNHTLLADLMRAPTDSDWPVVSIYQYCIHHGGPCCCNSDTKGRKG